MKRNLDNFVKAVKDAITQWSRQNGFAPKKVLRALARDQIRRNPSLSGDNKLRWALKGRTVLEQLEMPEVLKATIRQALDTPQYGPYHNEGLKMDTHLGLMMENIDAIAQDAFDFSALGLNPESTAEIAAMVGKAIKDNLGDMQIYAYLHDMEKPNTMAFKFKDKTQKIVTLAEWKNIVDQLNGDEAKIYEYLDNLGVRSITYRHDEGLTGGEAKDHGPEAYRVVNNLAKINLDVDRFLRGRQLILTGVDNHEMHFQVFSGAKSAKQYEANLSKNFKPEEIAFIYAACLIDIASSLGKDGQPDYSGFRNMVEARSCHQMLQELVKDASLKKDDLNALSGAQGLEALKEKLAKIKTASAPKTLDPAEIAKVLSKLTEMGISEEQRPTIEKALQSDNYSKALAAAGLSNLIGKIKAIVKKRRKKH